MSDAFDPDELAGVIDLFGALTPTELESALGELAFKRGESVDPDAVTAAVDDAVASYAVVRYRDGDRTLLAPGPAAFPTLPPNAEDLPHILDVPDREIDHNAGVTAVADRLGADAATAIDAGDTAAIRRLLDVTYDVEVWSDAAAVDDIRDRLDTALAGE
ncbi:hypothetical protein GCM10008995_19090 [Halobellus salinus]|uniref:Uncharacterized protein n=1 Tax=Halobellus salinus TaxID=931585 RepID=A0A830EH23_9EURY|nr:hypothetical protein [Halobellus salinus]GGJ09429.1 hypothetical protein GCM10008995_19090 [Halobellus salinus]SMP27374.1 hypothetical protein SAMN06265347_11282 [Halobellus salinus]